APDAYLKQPHTPIALSICTRRQVLAADLLEGAQIGIYSLFYRTVFGYTRLPKNDATITQRLHECHIMGYEQNRAVLFGHIFYFSQTFPLKCNISNGQNFVYQEDFRVQMGRYRKGEAHVHTAGIMFDRRIYKLIK